MSDPWGKFKMIENAHNLGLKKTTRVLGVRDRGNEPRTWSDEY
jgi:hypothetical protein